MMREGGNAICRTSTTTRRKKWNAESFIFFVSEGGDVFLCIETGGVNLYSQMIDDVKGLEVYHQSLSTALAFELFG
jgi:hypothetical protein